MNKKSTLLIVFVLFFSTHLFAGFNPNNYCAYRKKLNHHSSTRTTMADPAEANYDVKRLNFNLHLTDTTVFVIGDVTTAAIVIVPTLSNYVFELDTLMVIDSAKLNGAIVATTNVGNVRTISISTPLNMGAYFTVEIFYHGYPPAGGGFFHGLTHDSTAYGTQMVYSISDPYAAQDWWPAKQCIDDKIDTVDMFVTVPQGLTDGSNGILISIDSTTTPGFWQYHWQTHNPIDYYLISIAVAKYAEYKSYLTFTGTTDSMLIQNFLLDTTTFNPLYKANFDSIGLFIKYFSSLYGRYPFWQEKYGVCYTTLPGGMEHQTMTTIGVPNTYIIAHELCHQWFGDHVTYSRWSDVWLSEGFATFSEQLFLTHFWGAAAGKAHRLNYLYVATGPACGEVSVLDTSGAATLFNTTLVYAKAQAVVNMLRYIAPQDSLFFTVLKSYQALHAFGLASTNDLKSIADSIYGMNLDTFFNQWIFGNGYPKYKITWNQIGTTVYVKLVQTVSCPTATPLFYTPVELQLHGSSADTIVKVYNNAATQVFTFNWTPTMDSVMLNPDIWTLCRQNGAIRKDTTLQTASLEKNQFNVFPNPTKNYWQIDQLPENSLLELSDNYGKIIWEGKGEHGSTIIPAKQLSSGNYILKVISETGCTNIKLTHW